MNPKFKFIVALLSCSVLTSCVSVKEDMNMKYPKLNMFEQKMKAGERLKVAYLGGSITWGACASDQSKTSYRALVSKFLEETYPEARLKSIDAAIGGTPSKLGVFRMDRDVLPYNPDLTFIEFAVNDGSKNVTDSQETMEGIIRKLRSHNSDMAIVIVINGSGRGDKYNTFRLQEHIDLASYYGIPFADVCSLVRKKVLDGTLDTEVFLADGCHPNDTGYKIYADIIIDSLKKAFVEKGDAVTYPSKTMTENRYETAKMVELSKLADLGDWKFELPSTLGTWYDHQPSRWVSSAVVPKKNNAEIKVNLECSGIGVYYETVQKGGDIVVKSSDKELMKISTSMAQHYSRLGWTFELLDKSAKRDITLLAPKKENVKAAYILCVK